MLSLHPTANGYLWKNAFWGFRNANDAASGVLVQTAELQPHPSITPSIV